MGTNLDKETRQSVYIKEPFVIREALALHRAARELVKKHTQTGVVLEIGSSDMVTSRGLAEEGLKVYAVDLDFTALASVVNPPDTSFRIQADATHLPFGLSNIDVFLALETMEHLPKQDTIALLGSLGKICKNDFTAIVSMPIISARSLPTIREFIKMKLSGKRPDTGLFDKTHQILTDREGHIEIFRQAGLVPVETYVTNSYTGISGSWSFDPTPNHSKTDFFRQAFRSTILTIPKIVHPLDQAKQEIFFNSMVGFSCLYALKPKN